MKKLTYIFILTLFLNCSSDNNPSLQPAAIPGDTNTEFVIGTNAYVTPNAYLLLDDAVGDYDREFSFVFTDGNLVEDATHGIAFETSTTHFTKVTCNLIATSATQAQLPIFTWTTNPPTNIIMGGNNYSHTDITSFNDTNTIGGIDYGQVELSNSYSYAGQPQGNIEDPSHVFTVENITVDLNAGTGTIECRYNYDDDNGVNVNGVYVGTYQILTAF